MCRCPGHSKAKCPDAEYAKPDTPDCDEVVLEGNWIGVFDIETTEQGKVKSVSELGMCASCFNDGEWRDGANDFKVVVGIPVLGWAKANCKGLKSEATKSSTTFDGLWLALITYIQKNEIKYLKAHNGVSFDLSILIQNAGRAGILDPIGVLEEAGILGLIDPIRFIPQHQISDLMHPVTSGKAKPAPLSNGDLYYKATQRTMEEAGLIAHRALPDAKAEREWMTKLQSMKDAMFGGNPRLKCAVSMRTFRTYHEQYQKNRQYKAQQLTHL